MDGIKISVVCPVYNGGEYLKPFLESCIGQQMKEVEFICVDDGSTDSSAEVLKEYAEKDKRIKAIFNEHQGVGPTLKTGLKAAAGDYILTCDDDDMLAPNALQILYDASEGVADVVKGTAVYEKDSKIWKSNIFKSTEPLDWRRFDGNMLLAHFLQPPEVWSYIVRRELLPEIESGDYMCGDTDRVFKMKVAAKDFRYIPETVYIWRIHESASHSSRFPFDILKVYDNLERWLKERNINLWPVFGLSKFYAYEWNATRLSGDVLERFLDYARRDLEREVIDPGLLRPESKLTFENLMHRPSPLD